MTSRPQSYIRVASLSILFGVTCLMMAFMNEQSLVTYTDYNKARIAAQGRLSNIDSEGNVENQPNKLLDFLHNDPIRVKTQSVYPFSMGKYILNNPNICSTVEKVNCLIMVHTAPAHFPHRLGLRRTWANTSHYSPHTVRVIFLLGIVNNFTLQQLIETESRTFGDVIQGNFIDSYRNLSHKGVMGYRWISEHCQNAELILKTDDDAVVNMFKLFENFFETFISQKKTLWCNRIKEFTMPIIRKNNSKWFVDPDLFRGYKGYPTKYCSGFGLFMTADMIRGLYQAALGTPFFWVDDFYLFGWLPSRLKNVTYINIRGNLTFRRPEAFQCYKEKKSKCEYLIFPSKPHDIDAMWTEVVSDRVQSKYGYYYAKDSAM